MSTFHTPQIINVFQQGEIYNCTGPFGTLMATDAKELIDGLTNIKQAQIEDLFGDGTATSWTFVQSAFAAQYDAARRAKTAPSSVTTGIGPTFIGLHMAALRTIFPTELNDAIDWIDANAKSRVSAWTYPGTDTHFYIFEDPQEAVLFKLSVTV